MKQIPMLDLKEQYQYMKQDIDRAIAGCLEHQHWILGPEVKALEESAAGYLGVHHCVGASSGTDALVLALRAFALKRKNKEFFDKSDKIITTSFTFTATGDAILRAGATPVFVDIEPGTFNIDPSRIREYMKSGRNVAGIIPVHLYGQSCDMDSIMDIAEKSGLFVLEDVAQAFGGEWQNRKLGAIGDAAAFSFFPSKNLGGFGDGGLVATNDKDIAGIVRMLIKHGGRDKYNVDHIGYNARLDTLQAAIIAAKLKYIDEFNGKRIAVARTYGSSLINTQGLTLPRAVNGAKHVYHQYTVRIADGRRDRLQEYLQENGISSMVYYPVPLHKMKVFENRSITHGDLTESSKASEEVLSLPVEPLFDKETIVSIVDTIVHFFRSKASLRTPAGVKQS